MFARTIRPAALILFGLVAAVAVAPAQKRDEIRSIQRDMILLQDAINQTDRATAEKLVSLETLLKQNLEATNKLNQAVALIERTLNRQSDTIAGPVAQTAAKVDALSSQFGGLRDAVEESNSMVSRLQREVADIKNTLTTLPPPGFGADGQAGNQQDDSAFGESFFTNAVNDYNRGSYDLAKAQFTDFLRYSAGSSRAAEAQFYLGQIAYNTGEFEEAVRQFDLVLERYPIGVISADAQFKKGLALERLGRADAAKREYQTVLDRFPNSSVAANAQGKLDDLDGGGGKPSPFRP